MLRYLVSVVPLLTLVASRATINNNGYRDVVVAISPDLEEDIQLVDNIKNLLTKASGELYQATR